MHASAVQHDRIAPSARVASAVAALRLYECDHDGLRVAIPRPEIQLVVRFGPSTDGGVDVHALGVRLRAHRKTLRAGQRSVTARLRLGAQEAVLGVPVSEIAGRIVALEDLWGSAATRRLRARLADARDLVEAAALLESAIAERVAVGSGASGGARRDPRAELALAAADRLASANESANVSAVAHDLAVSERHLRRVFRETVGVSPKEFAKLARFHRALRAARDDRGAGWASIAAAAGYYDQAHLIAEFRAIAGVTPRALLGELEARPVGAAT